MGATGKGRRAATLGLCALLFACSDPAEPRPTDCSAPFQGSGAGDAPLRVSHDGCSYLVSCERVARGILGAPVDVTSEEEQEFGAPYGVAGRRLSGFDPGEAFAVRFVQRHCGEPGWVVAHLEGLPRARLETLFERLGS